MIRAIIFDLGGVVFTNGTKKFIQDLSQKHNLEIDQVKEIIDGKIGSDYREGKISKDKFWEIVKEKLNLPESSNNLEELWIKSYELIEETKQIILELTKKYKVYYLSDNVKERVEKLNQKYNFISWFADGVFSHEAGVRKPNPEIYYYFLKKFNLNPHELIFIDDKKSSLLQADRMGIKTILFISPTSLKANLKKFSI